VIEAILGNKINNQFNPNLANIIYRAAFEHFTEIGYEIEKNFREGGWALVLFGKDELGREVAIKVPKVNKDSGLRVAQTRSSEEARIIKELPHENIIEIYEEGNFQSGTPYMVQEYGGETLDKFVEGKKFDEYAGLLLTILEVSKFIADKDVVHRDLKANNITVNEEGIPKIIDFGLAVKGANFRIGRRVYHRFGSSKIAKLFRADEDVNLSKLISQDITHNVGCAAYMAPEVIAGGYPDESSQIFSLGVVFNELVAGCHPYHKDYMVPSVVCRLLATDITPIGMICKIPKKWSMVIDRMVKVDPEQRYQKFEDVLADMR
jgi:eukaryotic-like serine/threonine-protein kinase